MNTQLIEKIITSNNLPCPEFVYENPLLDKNVTDALSKSFVKILNISQQNCNVSNNLRTSILENIRKMCVVEPSNHARVDEKFTKLLSNLYEQNLSNKNKEESIEKTLDAFLIRRMKGMNIGTIYESSVNPEVVQALINLNRGGVYLDSLSQDIIHWSCSNNKQINVLKNLWTSSVNETNKIVCDDISIKLKSEIEGFLLDLVHKAMCEIDSDISSNTCFNDLVKKSSNSAECFQICSGVLNFLFIMTNYDRKVQNFIKIFIEQVKESCSHITFSVLYPVDISHLVVLLDFDIEILPNSLKNDYVKSCMNYLSDLHSSAENDLILLLSHFPQWFDVYCNYRQMPMDCL